MTSRAGRRCCSARRCKSSQRRHNHKRRSKKTGEQAMSSSTSEAENRMAALFEGLNRIEQLAMLGRLEMTGASIYRAFAKDEKNAKARERLLEAAKDEEKNGTLLRLMTTPKDQCERCGAAMAVASDGVSCSFQCT